MAHCIEIDGVFIKVSDRLRPLVTLLTQGCCEAEIVREVNRIRPGQAYEATQLQRLIDKLFTAQNLAIDEASVRNSRIWRLRSTKRDNKRSELRSAILCRITLIPEGAANRLAQAFRWLYLPRVAMVAVLFALLQGALYLEHFGLHSLSVDVLFHSIHLASMRTFVVAAAAIAFTSLFHEIGHCAAVAAFGARVRRIGCGIYWLSPALFSDISSAWTLSRWQRVAVDCGGIYFQALLGSCYAFAATLVSSRDIQLGLHIAIAADIVVLVCSLNPVMKCDGYWILSDAMSISNLRRESEKAVCDYVRAMLKTRKRSPDPAGKSRGFLLCYGIGSFLFTVSLLALFAIVISRNATVLFHIPQELGVILAGNFSSQREASAYIHFGVDLLRVLPVLFAPMALLAAASGVMGFISRASSETEQE